MLKGQCSMVNGQCLMLIV